MRMVSEGFGNYAWILVVYDDVVIDFYAYKNEIRMKYKLGWWVVAMNLRIRVYGLDNVQVYSVDYYCLNEFIED